MPDREEAFSDPWKFKEIVFSVQSIKARIQCEALLHLVHPDTFEHIASQYHKGSVASRLSYLAGEDVEDVEELLHGLGVRVDAEPEAKEAAL